MLTRSHRFRWTRILGCVVMLAMVLAVAGQTFAAERRGGWNCGRQRGRTEVLCDLAGRFRRLDRGLGPGLFLLQVDAEAPIRATSG